MKWVEFKSHVRHLSSTDLDRVKKAFELGEEAHKGQKRKSGEPYFTHSIAVADLLADMGADADTIIAALLHDAIEDTPLKLEDIEREIDGTVPELVDGATKLDRKELGEKPTLEEGTETLRKIFTYMKQDVRIMVIKLADRLHNIQTSEHMDNKRQRSFAQETMDVHVKVAGRLCMLDIRDELEGLCMQILDPKLFEELTEVRKENEKRSQSIINKISKALHESHPSLSQNISIHHEHKSWGRLKIQKEAEGMPASGVSALVLAFVCKDVQTCYRLFGALHEHWYRQKLSFEDYINTPMINGYQGLHTTVIFEDGTRVRCKIRTEEMQQYARRGITTKCFDSEAVGILDYLPWTDRIATLSEDTADRSAQFWDSLQSDILGETIVIHGPNDSTMSLPKGATALDGALYLFEEKALHVASISVDGKDATFSIPLMHAATLDMTLADKPTVRREWLDWVQTGFATALIRNSLSRYSQQHKINIGKELLQETFEKHKKGFIEEFACENVLEGISSTGYSSLKDAYISIADGHIDPEEIYSAIFEVTKPSRTPLDKRIQFIRFTFPLDNPEIVSELARVYKKHRQNLRGIRLRNKPISRFAVMQLATTLQSEEQQALLNDIRASGAQNLQLVSPVPKIRFVLGIALITILWGLDPVIARLLILHHHLSAIDMTLVRFWSLALTLLVVTTFSQRRKILQPIRLANPLLWSSAVLLTLVALTTYAALGSGTATHYEIVMTASGLLAATVFGSLSWRKGLPSWLLFGLAILLLNRSPAWNAQSIIFMLVSLACFSAFLSVSNRYMRQEMIARRRLEYYTVMLSICSILTLPLVSFASPAISDPITALRVFLFSVIFIGLPYYLYYELSPDQKTRSMIPFAFVLLTVTFMGELILTHQFDIFTLLAYLAMVLTAYFLERPQQKLILTV